MKGVYKVGGGWQARVYRNKVRRTASFSTEAEAAAAAQSWREMPLEQFLAEHAEQLDRRGVRLQRGKYWSAYVCRAGVRRSVSCASEVEAIEVSRALREMPIEDFIEEYKATLQTRGVALKQGKYWQAQVCRNGVRRAINCATEAEAIEVVAELRAMPIETFISEYELSLQTRGVALKQGKYWQAQVSRQGVRRAINCPSEKAALAKVRELRAMPMEEFRALTTNRKTDPAQL